MRVVNITELDKEALAVIARAGFVTFDNDEPCLETDRQITALRFHRLLAHGLIVPSGDALFPGANSQTYKPRD